MTNLLLASLILTRQPLSVASRIGENPRPDGVELARKFAVGDAATYSVKASLSSETKVRGIQTSIPEDLDLSYRFSTKVVGLGADGIAKIRYERPTFTIVEGETFNAPPKTTVEKLNLKFLLTLSPINEILAQEDLSPKVKKDEIINKPTRFDSGREQGSSGITEFVGELERLALCVGGFDSALDFAPRYSIDSVKVGDTWKKTVGYSPQKVKGKEGKFAVQRLDYSYTYKGKVQVGSKFVERVEATLLLDSDLLPFIKQNYEIGESDSELTSIPLKFNAKIEFDLDPKTFKTLSARATSLGGFSVIGKEGADDPYVAISFKGKTRMDLVVTPPKK